MMDTNIDPWHLGGYKYIVSLTYMTPFNLCYKFHLFLFMQHSNK